MPEHSLLPCQMVAGLIILGEGKTEGKLLLKCMFVYRPLFKGSNMFASPIFGPGSLVVASRILAKEPGF